MAENAIQIVNPDAIGLRMQDALLDLDELNVEDLGRIRVAPGGVPSFVLQYGESKHSVETLDVVVIDKQRTRAYWDKPYGEGDKAPACSSVDGKIGEGEPGGECRVCPYNEWGSAVNSQTGEKMAGKACREITRLMVLCDGSVLPQIVVAPPTSKRAIQAYLYQMLNEGRGATRSITRLSVVTDRNAGGIEYGKIALKFIEALSEADVTVVATLVEQWGTLLRGQPVETDIAGEDY